MNYSETTEYLFSVMPSFQNVGGSAYKPGLERIESFCNHLGNPHKSYPVIHVAGTNGKGSTSHMLAAVLQSEGYRVGLFTSPHLRDFRERMRVDGEMITEQEVVDFVACHREDMERLGLSFFEMTAAMAFNFFRSKKVDVAVIETGLGGRLDATNIVNPELSIITNIGIDHTQYLGTTLPEIASEKAGIIKPFRPVVVGERDENYASVMTQRAEEQKSDILFATDVYNTVSFEQTVDCQSIVVCDKVRNKECRYSLDLMGEYQTKNLLTLLTAVDVINSREDIPLKISSQSLRDGLNNVVKSTSLAGRWQRLGDSPLTICDTGHNAHGLREVTTQLKRAQYEKLYCVVGFAKDKVLRDILPLFPEMTHFIFTRAKVERAFTTAEIADVASELGLEFTIVDDVASALEMARKLAQPDDMIFVGGSNFVVAEI